MEREAKYMTLSSSFATSDFSRLNVSELLLKDLAGGITTKS
jgi:hypothetical protein